MSDCYVGTQRFYGHLEQEPKEITRGFKFGIVVVPSLKLSHTTFFIPQTTVNQFCTAVQNQLKQVHDVYRIPPVWVSICAMFIQSADCRLQKHKMCNIYWFSSPNCILVSLLLLQMLRTRTGWSGCVFAAVVHVGWHQVAEAEHGSVCVLIHSTPGQAEDAFSSSPATGGSHGIFLPVSSVTSWSARDRAASCP